MMREREDVVGLDASIIMHPAIWKASGHVDTFADLMRECPVTNKRVRADHVPPQSGMRYQFLGALHGQRQVASIDTVIYSVDLAKILIEEFIEKEVPPSLEGLSLSKLATYAESLVREYAKDKSPEHIAKLANELVEQMMRRLCVEPVSVMIPYGKPPESAHKLAIQFYEFRRMEVPLPLGERVAKVENTTDFHPESGFELGIARPFNLMLKTYLGPTATEADVAYLRPETAQAIFVQFKNVVDSTRVKVPFGIGQIGKAFRNEVTPRNFTFRSREFEQMELEFFIRPDEAVEAVCGGVARWSEGADLSAPRPDWGWEMWHRYWVAQRIAYYNGIGLGSDVLDYHWQTKDELAHYARACVDILFKFPFGTEELEGIAARGDFDLTQHQKHSGKSLEVFDEEVKVAFAKWTGEQRTALVARRKTEEGAKEKGGMTDEEVDAWCDRLFKGFYVPHVIEPSAGLDRLALAVLALAFSENEKTDAKGNKEVLTVMRFHPRIAPVKVGVFPLLKNKPELVAKARAVFESLRRQMACHYDEGGSIGKRYARQDEAGTPFCVTIDFDTIGENGPELLDTVTLRHRDDGRQERVKIADLPGLLLPQIQ